jgi:hypothetical protein
VKVANRISPSQAALWGAWASWIALIVIIDVLILVGSDHSVVPAYRDAALQWFAGKDIYNATGHGFLYFPSAAILFAPCALLPAAAGEIVWRLLTIGSFAVGIRRLSTVAGRGLPFDLFPLITLASLPPALSCARNGQSTLIMTALMILAAVDLAHIGPEGPRRWRATLWLSLSLAFKPLSLAMLLVVAALDWRMAWRLVLGVACVLLFPFLTQSPHYVAAQYAMSLQMFRASSLCGMNELWAQPFSVLSLMGITVPETAQTAIRVAAGLGTLALCWLAQRSQRQVRAVEYLLAFTTIYILLCNPRTENNTYAMDREQSASLRRRRHVVYAVPASCGGRVGAGPDSARRAHLAQAVARVDLSVLSRPPHVRAAGRRSPAIRWRGDPVYEAIELARARR